MRKKIRLAQTKDDDLHDLGSADLLSRLSDDILVTILSYFPLKDAAVTSKLSRRWRYVWCQRVCLNFGDKEKSNEMGLQLFQRTGTWKKYIDLVSAERNVYINWVNRIVRQHKSPAIEEFKICFDLDKHANGAISKWIKFAISKNVQTLELDLGEIISLCTAGNYVLPNKIFDRKCESSLKRSSFNVHVRPYATIMEIKFLKTLILRRVDVNDECLKKILSNCPILEHLLVYGSTKLVKAKINGKGLALKNLEIIDCHGIESIEMRDSNIVLFNCKRFNVDGSPCSLRFDNLQKLEKIYIRDSGMKINHMFCQISSSIPCLQVLKLFIDCPQKDMQYSPLPKLPKLKQLIIEGDTQGDVSLFVLTSMVEACPSLQKFTIKLIRLSTTSGLINRQVAKKPHQHLEVVELQEYCGCASDLELAMCFMENSVALKKLVIQPYIDEARFATKETTDLVKNATKNRVQRQLEPNIPVGVELVIL